jgi:hypothetical protein
MMKKNNLDFKELWKNRPRFNIKYIMMECPEFIVKWLQGGDKEKPDIYFWDDTYRKKLDLEQ